MNVPIHDIQLWDWLQAWRLHGELPVAPERLAQTLEACATRLLDWRMAWVGLAAELLETFDHPMSATGKLEDSVRARLRVALFKMLAGCTGHAAWRLFVEVLDEGDEGDDSDEISPVTRAAIEALAESARSDPARWVHVLYHRRAAVRRLGLEFVPEDADATFVLPLLADPFTRELVLDTKLDAALSTSATAVLSLLLSLWQHGQIDVTETMTRLAKLDWARTSTSLLEALPYWRASPEIAADAAPDVVWAHALGDGEHFGVSRDQLDVLVELLWQGLVGSVGGAVTCVSGLRRWAAQHATASGHARLARAILRVAARRGALAQQAPSEWPRGLLALAVTAFPGLLADERLALATRAVVVRDLPRTVARVRVADPLAPVARTALVRRDDGGLDLEIVAGVLALAERRPVALLFDHFELAEIADAFRAAPAASVEILCLDARGEDERKMALTLVDAVFTVADPDDRDALAAAADALTLVACEARGLGLRVLAQLHRFHPDMIVEVVPRVLAAHTEQALSERSIERLSETLAAQIGRRRIVEIIGQILDTPDVLGHRMARSLLCAMGRTGSTRGFQEAVAVLEATSVDRLLELLTLVADLGGFPWGREKALAASLLDHGDERVATWARARVVEHAPEAKLTAATIEPASALSATERDAITACASADLPALLRKVTEQPRRGLCAALRGRARPAEPDVDVAVALLASFDPIEEIDRLLAAEGYGSTEASWLEAVDRRMAARHQSSASLPLHGNAWLRLWEARLSELLAQLRAAGSLGERLLAMLDASLALRFAPLRERLWLAAGKAVTRLRWRAPGELGDALRPELVSRCVDVLLLGTSGASRRPWTTALDAEARDRLAGEPALKEAAAAVLRQAHERGCAQAALAEARDDVVAVAGELPPGVRELLRAWLDAREIIGLYERFAATCPMSSQELATVTASEDVAALAALCRGEHRALAEEAALRLCALGDEGRQALLAVVAEAPTWLGSLALCVALWPDTAVEPLRAARARVDAAPTPVAARFHIALALLERDPAEDDRAALVEAVVEALLAPSEADTMQGRALWMRPEDWGRLEALLGLDPLELARRLVTSPQPAAYTRAVAVLDAQPRLETEALGAFLRVDARRPISLRLQVARRLHAGGELAGWPLLFGQALAVAASSEDALRETLLARADRESIRAAVAAVLVVGDDHVDPEDMVDDLLRADVDPVARRSGLLRILKETNDTYAQTKALDKLRDLLSRKRKLWRLADLFAQGADLGRELTGKMFGIELIGGQDLGYTRLNEGRVFVNPLPMLRGEQNGRAVVEALIAHEIGHHVYHSGPVGQALWKRAAAEKLTGVFNLVLDEHLERNLRARREDVGNSLKKLAAYAFQHNRREIDVLRLIGHLSWRTFEVLMPAQLGVARAQGRVAVQTGEIFGTLESRGLSFSRFVRALRMGLGDRHGDARVVEALELFRGKRFRDASLDELYDIAVRLRQVFGEECAILDSLGQDGVGEAGEADVNRESEGLTNDEIQAEVERVRDPKRRGSGREDGRGAPGGKLWINVSEEHRFDRIERVVSLRADPAQHRALATEIARHSRRMREYLMRLGMRFEPQGARTRGRSVDRGRIQALVVRRDPRVLVMREPRMKTDLFLGIVVDCSGSMASGGSMDKARRFATLLAEAAVGMPHLDVRIFGFTDSVIYDGGTAARCAAHAMESGGGNNDAAGLWHAAQVALASRRKAKLLVMISDGLPTECSVAALRGLVENLGRRHRICCAQVAVRPLTEVCFPHYVEVTDGDLDASVRRFGSIVRKLVSRTVNA